MSARHPCCLPPFVHCPRLGNANSERKQNSDPLESTSLLVARHFDVEVNVAISELVKDTAERIEHTASSSKRGVLESTDQATNCLRRQALKETLMTTLPSIELVRFLVEAWRSVEIGILDVTVLACVHDLKIENEEWSGVSCERTVLHVESKHFGRRR